MQKSARKLRTTRAATNHVGKIKVFPLWLLSVDRDGASSKLIFPIFQLALRTKLLRALKAVKKFRVFALQHLCVVCLLSEKLHPAEKPGGKLAPEKTHPPKGVIPEAILLRSLWWVVQKKRLRSRSDEIASASSVKCPFYNCRIYQ